MAIANCTDRRTATNGNYDATTRTLTVASGHGLTITAGDIVVVVGAGGSNAAHFVSTVASSTSTTIVLNQMATSYPATSGNGVTINGTGYIHGTNEGLVVASGGPSNGIAEDLLQGRPVDLLGRTALIAVQSTSLGMSIGTGGTVRNGRIICVPTPNVAAHRPRPLFNPVAGSSDITIFDMVFDTFESCFGRPRLGGIGAIFNASVQVGSLTRPGLTFRNNSIIGVGGATTGTSPIIRLSAAYNTRIENNSVQGIFYQWLPTTNGAAVSGVLGIGGETVRSPFLPSPTWLAPVGGGGGITTTTATATTQATPMLVGAPIHPSELPTLSTDLVTFGSGINLFVNNNILTNCNIGFITSAVNAVVSDNTVTGSKMTSNFNVTLGFQSGSRIRVARNTFFSLSYDNADTRSVQFSFCSDVRVSDTIVSNVWNPTAFIGPATAGTCAAIRFNGCSRVSVSNTTANVIQRVSDLTMTLNSNIVTSFQASFGIGDNGLPVVATGIPAGRVVATRTNSTTFTDPAATAADVGRHVTGVGWRPGTYITQVSGSTVTVSQAPVGDTSDITVGAAVVIDSIGGNATLSQNATQNRTNATATILRELQDGNIVLTQDGSGNRCQTIQITDCTMQGAFENIVFEFTDDIQIAGNYMSDVTGYNILGKVSSNRVVIMDNVCIVTRPNTFGIVFTDGTHNTVRVESNQIDNQISPIAATIGLFADRNCTNFYSRNNLLLKSAGGGNYESTDKVQHQNGQGTFTRPVPWTSS